MMLVMMTRRKRWWYLTVVYLTAIFYRVKGQFESPCPNIFEYELDENQRLYGKVRLDNPTGNNIVLNVELSVGNSVQDFNGNIELTYGRTRAVDEIINGRPLYYNIYFPFWKVFPPRITKISVNGELICSGPPLDIKRVPILTTINLQHSLKISSLSLASPDENYRPVKPPNRFPAGNNIDQNRPQSFHTHNPGQRYPTNPFFTNSNAPPRNPPRGKPQDSSSFYEVITDIEDNPFIPPKKPDIHEEVTPKPPPPVTPTPIPVEIPDIDVRLNLNDVCGRSLSTNSLIANGEPVAKGYYPWLVALYNIKQLNLEFTCGGSLISNKHIVTAAHCMRPYERKIDIEQLLVIVGKFNIQRWTNDNSLMLSAKKVSVHPDYRALSADADVAVITLSQEVKFKSFIRPICLWNENNDLKSVIGDSGVVAGWGKDENGLTLSPEPKQVTLPIVSQLECLRSHDDFADITSDRTFCAGFRNGSGPCNGDSGGGFMMLRNGRWTLRGVVSMSIADQSRRCDLGQFLVFTDISKFSDWILGIVKQ